MIVFPILAVLTVVSWAAASSLQPRRMCVPSDLVTGPCHECVCAVDGVFHCREKKCSQQTDKNGTISVQKMECEPYLMYRGNTLFCTCSPGGHWIASKCRERFSQLQPRNSTSMKLFQSNETCIPHSLYLIDCNICRCNKEGHFGKFSCTKRFCSEKHKTDSCSFGDILRTEDEVCSCSDINLYIDRHCIKVKDESVQILNETALESIIAVGRHFTRTQELDECTPQSVYSIDCNSCFCTGSKMLACTAKMCVAPEDALRSGYHYGSDSSLPVLESEYDECTPGLKYRLKCNTCMCSPRGILSCTTMYCLED